jgi:hypothetical protein
MTMPTADYLLKTVTRVNTKSQDCNFAARLVGASATYAEPRRVEPWAVLWRQKKTGLVGPASRCVELDAVTSQHGAAGAEAAFLVGLGPGRSPGSASSSQNPDRRSRRRSESARKQTKGQVQVACRWTTLIKDLQQYFLLIDYKGIYRGLDCGSVKPAIADGLDPSVQTVAQVARELVQSFRIAFFLVKDQHG